MGLHNLKKNAERRKRSRRLRSEEHQKELREAVFENLDRACCVRPKDSKNGSGTVSCSFTVPPSRALELLPACFRLQSHLAPVVVCCRNARECIVCGSSVSARCSDRGTCCAGSNRRTTHTSRT